MPPSPCRKYLQEFIDFATGANRTPIGFYQAYPGLGVQDIHRRSGGLEFGVGTRQPRSIIVILNRGDDLPLRNCFVIPDRHRIDVSGDMGGDRNLVGSDIGVVCRLAARDESQTASLSNEDYGDAYAQHGEKTDHGRRPFLHSYQKKSQHPHNSRKFAAAGDHGIHGRPPWHASGSRPGL